jgi:hypothetical protein
MTVITPEEFCERFTRVVSNNAETIRASWSENKGHTHTMLRVVLPRIAESLNIQCRCDKNYWWLDGVFFDELDEVNFRGLTYAKAVSVAIEHENDGRASFQEINKLQLYNVPLKVLITYANDGENTKQLLSKYSSIICDADWAGDIATKRRQLVIFGDSADIWRFYIWQAVNDGPRFVQYAVPGIALGE